MAFARHYVESGSTYGAGVYHCKQCNGYHLTYKCAMSCDYCVTLANIGWAQYERILRLIDVLCGVVPRETSEQV